MLCHNGIPFAAFKIAKRTITLEYHHSLSNPNDKDEEISAIMTVNTEIREVLFPRDCSLTAPVCFIIFTVTRNT